MVKWHLFKNTWIHICLSLMIKNTFKCFFLWTCEHIHGNNGTCLALSVLSILWFSFTREDLCRQTRSLCITRPLKIWIKSSRNSVTTSVMPSNNLLFHSQSLHQRRSTSKRVWTWVLMATNQLLLNCWFISTAYVFDFFVKSEICVLCGLIVSGHSLFHYVLVSIGIQSKFNFLAYLVSI